jgi:NAD(P)-dependent dehydrogenase (short-subunit alcohol dehydrogenase family)
MRAPSPGALVETLRAAGRRPESYVGQCYWAESKAALEDGKRVAQKIGAAVIAQTPLGRVGNDTDLQGAAVYLASDASRRVTGQYIAVDGGASIA